jgi:hypothetical protein
MQRRWLPYERHLLPIHGYGWDASIIFCDFAHQRWRVQNVLGRSSQSNIRPIQRDSKNQREMKKPMQELIMLAALALCYWLIGFEWAVLIGLTALLINADDK